MSKISRVPTSESYNITSDWLDKFAKGLEKNSQILEITRYNYNEKFATIEDKMQDMKDRVGFDNVKTLKKESSQECCSENSCECVDDAVSDLKAKILKIIDYAKKVIEDRPEIKHMQLISDCRNLPQYRDISSKIEDAKFKALIQKILKDSKGKSSDISEIEHIPYVEMHQFNEMHGEDQVPSYYKKST